MMLTSCRVCEAPIASGPRGRRRHFCSAACKQKWYRLQRFKRQAGRRHA